MSSILDSDLPLPFVDDGLSIAARLLVSGVCSAWDCLTYTSELFPSVLPRLNAGRSATSDQVKIVHNSVGGP